MKIGDLVTIDNHCAPPELYGLGIITEITLSNGETGEPLRALVYWAGSCDWKGERVNPRTGNCAVKFLHKVKVNEF